MFARFGPGAPGTKNSWRCYGVLKTTNEFKACLDENGVRTIENCSDPNPVQNTFCYNDRLQEIIKEMRSGECPRILETENTAEELESTTQTRDGNIVKILPGPAPAPNFLKYKFAENCEKNFFY
jgi:hypothetical protein